VRRKVKKREVEVEIAIRMKRCSNPNWWWLNICGE
jgi:hypothetical protein